ncbi:MAG: TonB family protein [Aminobacterium colombiense]|uniref:TonB family protein n=1 Tax=Aminobacterium colombiense (strain DSM 12261 / ALA-1) TaxID=572547 RepID=D5ED48_AMICL|nr:MULTISPECIES: TonB family protein [Aminobacterium]MDD2378780.1 TonB family protein [Aminobacterium colombiense]ADE56480.1 TonB family protein [Aminobacterium colombiense DSM 12261]MDD3767340.1 TonB family protein [Aminobacterium colombiense]MDD4265151.1 TonB family protein [Aminobacterium colombiense]MDD4585357.1 TonB family protein [Aminobacterium colombiense]
MKRFMLPFICSFFLHICLLIGLSVLATGATAPFAPPQKTMTLRLVSVPFPKSERPKDNSSLYDTPRENYKEETKPTQKTETKIKEEKPAKSIPKAKTKPSELSEKKDVSQKKTTTQRQTPVKQKSANVLNAAANETQGSTAKKMSMNKSRAPLPQHQESNLAIEPVDVASLSIKKREKPLYPLLSRRKGEEGKGIFIAIVEKGKVITIETEQSCGYDRLDKAAYRALKTWLFSEDFTGKVRIPVIFSLKD